MSDESIQFSQPSPAQHRLLGLAAQRWKGHSTQWTDDVLVAAMPDGGMGSLRLRLPNSPEEHQRFGGQVADFSFADADGVLVLVALNVDERGVPFELDVWKADFSPLQRVPEYRPAEGREASALDVASPGSGYSSPEL